MRLLKVHKGQKVDVYLDGVTFRGVLVDVAADSVSMREVTVIAGDGSNELPGPVVVSTASIVWAGVNP